MTPHVATSWSVTLYSLEKGRKKKKNYPRNFIINPLFLSSDEFVKKNMTGLLVGWNLD